jgi:hypothetical protein
VKFVGSEGFLVEGLNCKFGHWFRITYFRLGFELEGGIEKVSQKEDSWVGEDFGELFEAELARQNIEASQG